MWTTTDPYRDAETLARLAGPDAERVLREVKQDVGATALPRAETLRRFRVACLDGTFGREQDPHPVRRAGRKVRRGRPAADAETTLRHEIKEVEELGVRVALAGLDEAFEDVDAAVRWAGRIQT